MDALDLLLRSMGDSQGWQMPQLPLRPEDYGQFRQRPPLAGGQSGSASGPPPMPFDLPAPSGYVGRLDQPTTPLNLRAVPGQSELPFALTGGGYSMGKKFGQTSEPLNLQAAYNLQGLPFDISGGTSLRPGRGLGGVDLRAYFRQPF
jgi:hypothetical protein